MGAAIKTCTSDLVRRATLARRNHNEKLHDTVIDAARFYLVSVYVSSEPYGVSGTIRFATTLHNEDVLLTHRASNINGCFTIREFLEIRFTRICTQPLADGLRKQGMRCARENLDSPHVKYRCVYGNMTTKLESLQNHSDSPECIAIYAVDQGPSRGCGAANKQNNEGVEVRDFDR